VEGITLVVGGPLGHPVAGGRGLRELFFGGLVNAVPAPGHAIATLEHLFAAILVQPFATTAANKMRLVEGEAEPVESLLLNGHTACCTFRAHVNPMAALAEQTAVEIPKIVLS